MSLSFPLVPPSISLRKNPPVSCLEAGLYSKPTWTSLPRFHPLPRYCLQPWLQSPESLQSDFRRARAHDFLLGWVGEGTAGGDLQTWAPCLTPSFMVPFSVLLPSQRSVGWLACFLLASPLTGRYAGDILSSASSVTASLSPFCLSHFLWSYTCRLKSFYFHYSHFTEVEYSVVLNSI